MSTIHPIALAGAMATLLAGTAATASTLLAIDPAPNHHETRVTDLNEAGQVAGYHVRDTPEGERYAAFRWTPGSSVLLGRGHCLPARMNAAGEIAAACQRNPLSPFPALDEATLLVGPGVEWTYAFPGSLLNGLTAVSDTADVVGRASGPSLSLAAGPTTAAWFGAPAHYLDAAHGTLPVAIANPDVAGSVRVLGTVDQPGSCFRGGRLHACRDAVLWDTTFDSLTYLPRLPGAYDAEARDMDPAGTMAVGALAYSRGDTVAVAWTNLDAAPTIAVLPSVPADSSHCRALGVSSDGLHIVGSCRGDGGRWRAVAWDYDELNGSWLAIDLNAAYGLAAGFELRDAVAVNGAGRIIGHGRIAATQRAFVLDR